MAVENFRVKHGLTVNNFINTVGSNVVIGSAGTPTYDFEVTKSRDSASVVQMLYNSSTTSSSVVLQLNAGNRYVNFVTDYTGQYLVESGSNINTRFFDYNSQIFRNTGGTTNILQLVNNGIIVATGNTLNRPAATSGTMRYNTDDTRFEFVVGGAWDSIVGEDNLMKVYDSANTQLFP